MLPTPRPALIVDDEAPVRHLMIRWASMLGLESDAAEGADEALNRIQDHNYELAVIDVAMPGHDGLWLANRLRAARPDMGVVMATGHADRVQDLCAGLSVADVLVKPMERDRFLLALDRGRQWHAWATDETRWHARISWEVAERLDGLRSDIEDRTSRRVREIDVLLGLLRERLPQTHAHAWRVATLATTIAEALGLDRREVQFVENAARLHDVGKLVIPERVLAKPGPLTPGETRVMRRHAETGADLLTTTRTLRSLAPVVHASHEWFNGEGYPRKLAGTDIPLASRIIGVADAHDTMTYGRPYRAGRNAAAAAFEIFRSAGTQFDPEVVTVFLREIGRPDTIH